MQDHSVNSLVLSLYCEQAILFSEVIINPPPDSVFPYVKWGQF